MTKFALLIEDDPDGLNRAKRCAPNQETLNAYCQSDLVWIWVKNYDEFVQFFTNKVIPKPIPDLLCFDHDLHDSAYELWHKHKGYVDTDINYDEYQTKTGYHCAKWLVDYCLDNNIKFEAEVYSHSMNTKGRENILALLNNFKKHQ